MNSFVLGLIALLSATAPCANTQPAARQEGGKLSDWVQRTNPYEPVRPKSRQWYFAIDGDLKAEPVRKALTELSTPAVECRVLQGPLHSNARPNKNFLTLEAPSSVSAKELAKALKRGAAAVEELSFSVFEGDDGELGNIPDFGGNFTAIDFIIGMSSDLRWMVRFGARREFYFPHKKLDTKTIQDRFQKLNQPFGGQKVGSIARESFAWPLQEPLDAEACKRAQKSIAKLDGVAKAEIDLAAKVLRVDLALENLRVSGPPVPFLSPTAKAEAAAGKDGKDGEPGKPGEPGQPGGKGGNGGAVGDALNKALDRPPRASFDTTPVFDILEKEKLVLAAPSAAPQNPGPNDPPPTPPK